MVLAAFWAMTPRETEQVIAAENWRADQSHDRDMLLAWHVAALTRAKKMPALRALLRPKRSGPITEEEKAERKQEFEELTARMARTRDGRR